MFNFDNFSGAGAVASVAAYGRNREARSKAERQKNENLRLLTLDAMTEAGIDPYAIYEQGKVDSTIDPDVQAEMDLSQQEMDILNPPEEVAEGYAAEQYIKDWRADNQDLIGEAYDAFLRSGLDYPDYKKQFPVEETSILDDTTDDDYGVLDPANVFVEEQAAAEETQRAIDKAARRPGIINDYVTNNPNITLVDLLDLMKKYGVGRPEFEAATGKTPEEVTGTPAEDVVSDPNTGTTPEVVDGDPNTGTSAKDVVSDPPLPPNGDLNDDTHVMPDGSVMPGATHNDPVTTEDGMFAAVALSPDRTTSEILAPDLFKLDNKIPLIGKLTTYVAPPAQPMLLQGISQRYRT
tara:strand:+ start:506 stop:1555 length:1050 start_codon:yes stop_codon:yes gene_type:complete